LIEKVRTAVSDGTGQFQIVNLVPGTYTVTFTLGGFNTVKREGVVLSDRSRRRWMRDARRRARGDDHRHRRDADRGRAEHEAPARHRPRDHRQHPDEPHGLRHGVAHPRRLSRGLTIRTWVDRPRPAPDRQRRVHGSRTGDQIMLRNGVETVGQASTGFSTPVNINPIASRR